MPWKKKNQTEWQKGKPNKTAMVIKPEAKYAAVAFNRNIARDIGDALATWSSKGVVGSAQQQAIWDSAFDGQNKLVNAGAGTGKTFTSLHHLSLIAGGKMDLVESSTCHSMMMRLYKQHHPKAQVKEYKVYDIVNSLMGIEYGKDVTKEELEIKGAVISLVGLLKNTMMEPNTASLGVLTNRFCIDTNGHEAEIFDYALEALERNNQMLGVIDFDDMIYQPVRLGLQPRIRYEFMVVDEAQDYNTAQRLGAMIMADQFLVIGDRRQSIYAFRGADARSMDLFKAQLPNVEEFPLMQTRRCPKAVVESVQDIVPDYEALPEAPEGSVDWCDQKQARSRKEGFKPGDMVLCRRNAPLVGEAFSMLSRKIRCKVQGSDIGKGLIKFIQKLGATSVDDLQDLLGDYETRELERLRRRAKYRPVDEQIQALTDKVDCLKIFMEGQSNLAGVETQIQNMFTDSQDRSSLVTLSSIHKAKGQEAENIWIVERDRMPSLWAKTPEDYEQEENLIYVGHTRTKKALKLIHAPKLEVDNENW